MWKLIKHFILFLFMISILFILRFDKKRESFYRIINDGNIFAIYTDGNVYIGDSNFINNLNNTKDKDILILDDHNNPDADYKIISSYKVTDNVIQNEIINILLEYNKLHPSSWNRSFKSMKAEWIAHNLLYYFDYQVGRTRDVDFNNVDEKVYNRKMVKKVIKKIIKKVINRIGN